jgi:conjugative relaxase-like TrwC/TraI family protein
MLSPKTQTNLKNAKGYFEEHLRAGDYYAENQRVQGEWIGEGAALLGLVGIVVKDDFLTLCENKHPASGERLTQRRNSVRRDGLDEVQMANRRVFYDFTFSPPKSVSIAAFVANDRRIAAAHAGAVKVALLELERFAATRVRDAAQNSDRPTKNIVAALFEHNTSRALDPHLHTHCIVFNATHDECDHRWKALQNHQMLSAQKYVENVYYHELARALRSFGYTIVNSARGDFEIGEVSPEIRPRFSKRHQQIDQMTQAFLAAHPEMRESNQNKIREYVALKTRARKTGEPTEVALRKYWMDQLSPSELATLCVPEPITEIARQEPSAAMAVSWAEEHVFERHAVVQEHQLWRHALAFARGSSFSIPDLRGETTSRPYIRTEERVAHRDALAREWAIVEAAREGIGRYAPLARPAGEDVELAPDQRQALNFILSSASFITLFRGGAGTGKSFVLKRVQRALEQAGSPFVILTPQRQQTIDLMRDGLSNTQTVSECLHRESIPAGAVVIVDEAGQIGGKQMLDLVRLVQKKEGRMILSGDTRQHGPVEASDALRAIERYSGLRGAELTEIRRQDPARGVGEEERRRIQRYREAVKAASVGDMEMSFAHLEEIGAIIECGPDEQRQKLSDAYMELCERGESAIVVSQTQAEVQAINENIRGRLRERKKLMGDEVEVISLERVDLTQAQMRDQTHYPPGGVLVFNQDYRGIRRGQQGGLVGITVSGIALEIEGRVHRLPLSQLGRLTACRARSLPLCAGDKLQLKANGAALDTRKLANGEVVTIASVDPSGRIVLADGRTLPSDYRQFQRGYAVTSYGSQGKTVDHVLFGDSGVRAASDTQQWYVTISRGRKSIRIFTGDKEQLHRAVSRSGERALALDLGSPPLRSRRSVLEQVLRGLKRGREFARRIAVLASRARAISLHAARPSKLYETSIRNRQTNRNSRTNVLAP